MYGIEWARVEATPPSRLNERVVIEDDIGEKKEFWAIGSVLNTDTHLSDKPNGGRPWQYHQSKVAMYGIEWARVETTPPSRLDERVVIEDDIVEKSGFVPLDRY